MSRYRRVLGSPGAAPLVCAAAVGRLPYGMTALSIVLLGRARGVGYGGLGLLLGAVSLGAALSLPPLGRAVDRFGERRVLVPTALGFAVSGSVLIAALVGSAPRPLAALAALGTGALVPPLGPCMRALWPRLVHEPELLATAYSFEAAIQEFAFIAGPVLAGVLSVVVAPASALICSVCAGCVGGLWFAAAVPRAAPPAERPHRREGALARPGVRTVLLAYLSTGAAFGAVEVAMPAFCEAHGHRAAAGFALGAFSFGSLLGGVWYGSSRARTRPLRSYLLAVPLLAVVLVPPLLAPSIAAMVVLMAFAGLPIAPGFAAAYLLLDDLMPPHAVTEVFAWISTCIIVGTALGTAVGGAAIQTSGWRAALALAAAAAALAAATALARRHTLRGST